MRTRLIAGSVAALVMVGTLVAILVSSPQDRPPGASIESPLPVAPADTTTARDVTPSAVLHRTEWSSDSQCILAIRVLDSSNQPLAGARARVVPSPHTAESSVTAFDQVHTSDSHGVIRLPYPKGKQAPSAGLIVTKVGHALATVQHASCDDAVRTERTLEVILEKLGEIVLRVVDHDNAPRAGIDVVLKHPSSEGLPGKRGTTDARGMARFDIPVTATCMLALGSNQFAITNIKPDALLRASATPTTVVVGEIVAAAVRIEGDRVMTFNHSVSGNLSNSACIRTCAPLQKALEDKFRTPLVSVAVRRQTSAVTATWRVLTQHSEWLDIQEGMVPIAQLRAPRIIDRGAHDDANRGQLVVAWPGMDRARMPRLSLWIGKVEPPAAIIPIEVGEPCSLPAGDYWLVSSDRAMNSSFGQRDVRVTAGTTTQFDIATEGRPRYCIVLLNTSDAGAIKTGRVRAFDARGRRVQDQYFEGTSEVRFWLPLGQYTLDVVAAGYERRSIPIHVTAGSEDATVTVPLALVR